MSSEIFSPISLANIIQTVGFDYDNLSDQDKKAVKILSAITFPETIERSENFKFKRNYFNDMDSNELTEKLTTVSGILRKCNKSGVPSILNDHTLNNKQKLALIYLLDKDMGEQNAAVKFLDDFGLAADMQNLDADINHIKDEESFNKIILQPLLYFFADKGKLPNKELNSNKLHNDKVMGMRNLGRSLKKLKGNITSAIKGESSTKEASSPTEDPPSKWDKFKINEEPTDQQFKDAFGENHTKGRELFFKLKLARLEFLEEIKKQKNA